VLSSAPVLTTHQLICGRQFHYTFFIGVCPESLRLSGIVAAARLAAALLVQELVSLSALSRCAVISVQCCVLEHINA